MTQVKIVVDEGLCEGNGMCVVAAPRVFEIGDDDQLHVLVSQPSAADMTQVDNAIRRCPRGALSLAAV